MASKTYKYDITGLFDTLTFHEVLENMYGHDGDTFRTGKEIEMSIENEDDLIAPQQIWHTLLYDKIALVINTETGKIEGVEHD